MADKKILALKLMARFSVHKRGSNEDPGTNAPSISDGPIRTQWHHFLLIQKGHVSWNVTKAFKRDQSPKWTVTHKRWRH